MFSVYLPSELYQCVVYCVYLPVDVYVILQPRFSPELSLWKKTVATLLSVWISAGGWLPQNGPNSLLPVVIWQRQVTRTYVCVRECMCCSHLQVVVGAADVRVVLHFEARVELEEELEARVHLDPVRTRWTFRVRRREIYTAEFSGAFPEHTVTALHCTQINPHNS